MQKQDATALLKEAIFQKEIELSAQGKMVKEHFHVVYESFRPVNLIKNAFRNITESKEIKGNLLDMAIGLATGFISKKIMVGSSHNPVKNILGDILQVGVTSLVTKNPVAIKSLGGLLIQTVLRNIKPSAKKPDERE